ncbi:MAG: WYL domain-containing protein, partial [Raoultibacter sp.]
PSDWLDMDFSFWGAPPEYKRAFDVIRQAICTRHLLRFPYFDAVGNATIRTVEAGKLVFKESCWYMRAYCLKREAWRTFKLFRIDWENMELLPERFTPRPLPENLDESGAYPKGKTHVKLLISSFLKERVREEFAPEMITYQEAGSLLVEIDCNIDDRTRYYLLSFGSNLEVLEPASVRTWITEQAQSIAALYANPSPDHIPHRFDQEKCD